MSIEIVRDYLKQFQADDRILEFETSSATVELAAQAVGCIPARIAKTLSFYTEDGCMLIVAAGDAKIDNSKFKHFFGYKAKMLNAKDVVTMTNHAIGGVCPFGVPENVAVYLDKSMQRFDTIFPACGSSNSAIELDCDTLFTYSRAKEWIDVCKGWQDEV
ncbi:MAG: YbaK/EbsC family protein [Peptococcaceae bacterium]|nr:YbaK/EbsC family protein [Peptococcaceae bacterium]